MALPHPHGNSIGQIGYGSVYDDNDLLDEFGNPLVGGRFVGFAEVGVSAAANRAHWALSANTDYVYSKLQTSIAIPKAAQFTSSGQSKYRLSGTIFTGDSTYPSSVYEGSSLLFGLLDEFYNELTDSDGNEIRVKAIKDSSEGADVYKGGFISNPWVYFCAVNPVTGSVVTVTYVIPASTKVKIIYGIQGDLENLPTDALTRYKINSSAEIEAGVFLQNGTRKITGDADWNSKNILNISEIRGKAAANLLVNSLKSVTVQGTENVLFKDQYLSHAVNLSESGVTDIPSTVHHSIVGNIKNNYDVLKLLSPYRCLNRDGNFICTNTTHTISYPELSIVQGNETKIIAAGTKVTTLTNQLAALVVTSAGVIEERTFGNIGATNILLYQFYYISSSSTYDSTKCFDIRLPLLSYAGNALTIRVGRSSSIGIDIDNLSVAFNISSAYSRAYYYHPCHATIEIYGRIDVSSPCVYTGSSTLRIIGVTGNAAITTSGSFPISQHLISTENGIVIEDLNFYWGGTINQSGIKAAINCVGDAVFKNCIFSSNNISFTFGQCICWTPYNSGITDPYTLQTSKLLIDGCYFRSNTISVYPGLTVVNTSATLDISIINSVIEGGEDGVGGFFTSTGSGLITSKIQIHNVLFYKLCGLFTGVPVGPAYVIDIQNECPGMGSLLTISDSSFDYIGSLGGVLNSVGIDTVFSGNKITNNLGNGISSDSNLKIVNSYFSGFGADDGYGVKTTGDSSITIISNNSFEGVDRPSGYYIENGVYLRLTGYILLSNNRINSEIPILLQGGDSGSLHVSNNKFSLASIHYIDCNGLFSHITNNTFSNVYYDTCETAIADPGANSTITNNYFNNISGSVLLAYEDRIKFIGNTCCNIKLYYMNTAINILGWDCTVNDNFFDTLGNLQDDALVGIIYVLGSYCQIIGNRLSNPYLNGGYSEFINIYVEGKANIVSRNIISGDLITNAPGYASYGVFLGGSGVDSIVSENIIDWSATEDPHYVNYVFAIRIQHTKCTVCFNRVLYWEPGVTPPGATEYAIDCRNSDNTILMGNWSEYHTIAMTSSHPSNVAMAIGQVVNALDLTKLVFTGVIQPFDTDDVLADTNIVRVIS